MGKDGSDTSIPRVKDVNSTTEKKTDSDSASIREAVGDGMHEFTELVNRNIIAARYGAIASITLLAAYGLSNTPLFFRFRTVSDIPAAMFSKRKKLYGRVISVVPASEQGRNTIQILVRHLSPVGQIIPKSWFDFLIRLSPSSIQSTSSISGKNDTLQIQLAGVQYPPVSRLHYEPEQWLENLVQNQTLVGLHLLARQMPQEPINGSQSYLSTILGDSDRVVAPAAPSIPDQVAICRVTYRPTLLQLFSTDVAEALVRSGNASASSSVFADSVADDKSPGQFNMKISDASQQLQDICRDVKYLDQLAKVEFEAVRESNGMWSVPEVRKLKQEVVDEVEFQSNASIWQKIWRRLRG